MVGFVGYTGSSTTRVAKYLSVGYGFQYAGYRQVLQDWFSSDSADRDQPPLLTSTIMDGVSRTELNRCRIAARDRIRSVASAGHRHQADHDNLSGALGPLFLPVCLEVWSVLRFGQMRSSCRCEKIFHAAGCADADAHIEGLKSLASTGISNEEALETLRHLLHEWIAVAEMGERK